MVSFLSFLLSLLCFFHPNQTSKQLAIAPVIDPTIVPIKEAVLRPLLPPPELLLPPLEVGVTVLALVEVGSVLGDDVVVVADIDVRDVDVNDVVPFLVEVEPGIVNGVEAEEACDLDADETSTHFNN